MDIVRQANGRPNALNWLRYGKVLQKKEIGMVRTFKRRMENIHFYFFDTSFDNLVSIVMRKPGQQVDCDESETLFRKILWV